MTYDLKSFFDGGRVRRIAKRYADVEPSFPTRRFVRDATTGLDELELLDRARHISAALAGALPSDYPAALAIIMRSFGPPLASPEGNGMEPFQYLPDAMFIAEHGLDHVDESLAAQHELTKRMSCEFSVRAFLERHEEKTLRTFRVWVRDPDEHVRRLVSEGTRPRLPWASRLRRFQADPTPVLPLLEALRDDPSLYVRRSVANHLNDITRDHPGLVLDIAERWAKDAPEGRAWLIRHAVRSLVKQGEPRAIALLGGTGATDLAVATTVEPRDARIGGKVTVTVSVKNLGKAPVTTVLGIRIHFVKASGATNPKVFRLPTTVVAPGETVSRGKSISLAQLTTRTHHPGEHRVDALVDGRAHPAGAFRLRPARA